MTRPLLLALLCGASIAACAPLAGADAPRTPAAAEPSQADRRLMAFFEAHDAATLARSPQLKAFRGVRDADYGRWDDPSDEAAARHLAADVAALEDMRRLFGPAPLSDGARLSYQLFERQLERRIAADRFRHNGLVFNQMSGAQSALPAFLINIHRVSNAAEAQAYVERLEGLGPQIDALIAVADARPAGPAWVYPHVIRDAQALLSGAPFEAGAADTPLLADFRAKLARTSIEADAQARLLRAAERALLDSVGPAYRRLIAAMERHQARARATDGVSGLPDGQAWYAERLAFHTTTRLTAAEIHDLGLAEVARIHAEMVALMPKLGVTGGLSDLLAHVRDSDEFYLPDTDEGRARYLEMSRAAIAAMERRLPEAFHTLPRAPLEVRRVEPFREQSAGKAFYQRPAADGSRPGVYYANLFNMREMPIYEIEALAFHEGLPGHHLQIAIQTELADVPQFRREGGFTVYSEGWALYAELLPKEMGFYEDPWQDFGRLKLDLWRAVRLVVDTGLHAKGWSREKAIAYHLENTPSDRAEIVRAVERYAIMPGQATAYAIGKLEILRMREAARQRLGPRFDIRDFHEVVLGAGPLPLDILEERVAAWSARGTVDAGGTLGGRAAIFVGSVQDAAAPAR